MKGDCWMLLLGRVFTEYFSSVLCVFYFTAELVLCSMFGTVPREVGLVASWQFIAHFSLNPAVHFCEVHVLILKLHIVLNSDCTTVYSTTNVAQ